MFSNFPTHELESARDELNALYEWLSQSAAGEDHDLYALDTATQVLERIIGTRHDRSLPSVPNPVLATKTAIDGGTIRLYKSGMVDAVDGYAYVISPGFDTYEECERWIRETLPDWFAAERGGPHDKCDRCGHGTELYYCERTGEALCDDCDQVEAHREP